MLANKGLCLVDAACDTGEEQEIEGPRLQMRLEVIEGKFDIIKNK